MTPTTYQRPVNPDPVSLDDMDRADKGYRRIRKEFRAFCSTGTPQQRAAELAARMCHGVEFIVRECDVSKDEAEMLVLGRTTSKNTPVPNPIRNKSKSNTSRSRRSRAINNARGLLRKAEDIVMELEQS
jgi:hypothetical protein